MPQTVSSSSTLSRNLVRSFVAMLLLLLALLGFALLSFNRLSEADGWKVHTYKVLLQSQQLKENLFVMDNAVRGYIVNGQPQNLIDLETGKASFHDHLLALQQLVSDNPPQVVLLSQAVKQKDAYLQIAVPVLQRRLPSDTTQEAVRKTSGTVAARRDALNAVRATLNSFEDVEKGLLQDRIAVYNRWEFWTEVTLGVGSAFSVLLTLFLSSLAVRAVRESASAYARLRETNDRLESTNTKLESTNTQLALAKDGLEVEIDQRREAEDKLRRAVGELRRSNGELEQFAYVASHDLQEPLRAVAGCVQVLKRRYGGKLDERADQFIDHAVDGAQRMQNLIQDLLAYSRVGTKGKPFAQVSLETIADAAQLNLTTTITESGAHIERSLLPTLYGDAGQLEQVFQNLLSNALKFRVESPPQIVVKSTPAEDADKGRGWTFSISDRGPGIEPQYFERIFVMFQRLHTRTEYPGTGIGLAIVKKIIERHGGRIWVESEVGQGTTFSFWLPEKATDHLDRSGADWLESDADAAEVEKKTQPVA